MVSLYVSNEEIFCNFENGCHSYKTFFFVASSMDKKVACLSLASFSFVKKPLNLKLVCKTFYEKDTVFYPNFIDEKSFETLTPVVILAKLFFNLSLSLCTKLE